MILCYKLYLKSNLFALTANPFIGNNENIAAGFIQSNFHSPSPSTMLASLNNSGPYLCQSKPSNDFLLGSSDTTSANTHQQHPLQQQQQQRQQHDQQKNQQPQDPDSHLSNNAQHQSSGYGQIDNLTLNLNTQLMFSNESNYSSLMRHLYNNDDQHLPNIDCETDIFSGNQCGGKSAASSMSSGRNDCQFPGESVNQTDFNYSNVFDMLSLIFQINNRPPHVL